MDHEARARRTTTQKALHVLIPYLAHRHHRRYEGKTHHFLFDTLLSAGIFGLLAWNAFLLATHAAILQPSVDVVTEAPQETASGATFEIVVTVQNKDDALSSATVELTYPTAFLFAAASQPPLQGTTNRWEFHDVEPEEVLRIAVTGQIVGAPNSDVAFKTVLAAQTASGPVARILTNAVRITAPALTVSLSGPASVESGAPATFTVVLANAGADALRDVSLVLEAPKSFTLTSSAPHASKSAWTFATLDPHAQASVTFTGTFTSAKALDTTLTVRAALRAGDAQFAHDDASLQVAVTAAPTVEDVVTEPSPAVRFASEARYTAASGITVGFGPVPLKVGATTGFRIFFVIQKPDDAYTRAVLTATLPEGVRWLGNAATTAGNAITYDAATRTVRWTVDPIRHSMDVLSGGFDVAVTPTNGDVGRALPLLGTATLSLTGDASATVRAPALTSRTTDLGTRGIVVR